LRSRYLVHQSVGELNGLLLPRVVQYFNPYWLDSRNLRFLSTSLCQAAVEPGEVLRSEHEAGSGARLPGVVCSSRSRVVRTPDTWKAKPTCHEFPKACKVDQDHTVKKTDC